MELDKSHVFCDWITVSQKHEIPHSPVCMGIRTTTDPETGEVISTSHVPFNLRGEHGSNLQISSDGNKVTLSGNPSRYDRSENIYGLDLDQTKAIANQILQSLDLPPFSDGEIIELKSKPSFKKKPQEIYSGATISRVDMTTNFATGSAANRDAFQQHLQTQQFPKLTKDLCGKNVYFGKDMEKGKVSESRILKLYDKALQLSNCVLPGTDEPEYINALIEWAETLGLIRAEMEYHRYLRNRDLRYWHVATHEALANQFVKDIGTMVKPIEKPDYGNMPKPLIATLSMYMCGHDVKEILHRNTYDKHKKELKRYGYDISNQNIHLVQPKIKVITLTPAEMPEFYKKPIAKLKPKAVK